LVSCVFARQIWYTILQKKIGLASIAPQPSTHKFSSWWCKAVKEVAKDYRKGFNSLAILVAWEIWKVFNGSTPSITTVLRAVPYNVSISCS
jgi:hypothetical protein